MPTHSLFRNVLEVGLSIKNNKLQIMFSRLIFFCECMVISLSGETVTIVFVKRARCRDLHQFHLRHFTRHSFHSANGSNKEKEIVSLRIFQGVRRPYADWNTLGRYFSTRLW